MLSLQILNPYGKLLQYPEENDIKEDSQPHLGHLKTWMFFIAFNWEPALIGADRQPRKYYRTGYIVVNAG